MNQFTACGACNRGGNGNDKDKCACGWQTREVNALGCYLGTPIVGPIKTAPKLTISQARYQRFLTVADCFESFRDFLKYDTRGTINA